MDRIHLSSVMVLQPDRKGRNLFLNVGLCSENGSSQKDGFRRMASGISGSRKTLARYLFGPISSLIEGLQTQSRPLKRIQKSRQTKLALISVIWVPGSGCRRRYLWQEDS